MNHLRGKFIVFDGGEGCGKSTQARLLEEKLESQGIPILHVHDPGTTRIGGLIRKILLDAENTDMGMRCEMLLYMAARAQMIWEKIQPALSEGKVVVSDRFVSSTLAYQQGGDELTAREINNVAKIAIKDRWPDLVIILDMPVEKSSSRIHPQLSLPFPEQFKPRRNKDRIEQRSLEYHTQVRKRYLDQAKADPKRHKVINADRSIEQVQADVLEALKFLI